MPDDETKDENLDEGSEEEKKEEPKYAKEDDIVSLRQSLSDLKDLLGSRLATPAASPQPEPHKEPTIDDVSDDDLDGSLSQGAPVAKKFRTAMRAEVAREVQQLRRELNELRAFGVSTMGEIGERIAEGDMPYKKHAKLGPIIQREIDTYAKFEPAAKTNPKLLKAIHDRVVGEHLQELVQEETEKAVRKARDDGGGSIPTGKTGRGAKTEANEVPTVEELLGADAATALRERGQDADTFSRRLGYKDWASYAEVIKKQQTPEGAH